MGAHRIVLNSFFSRSIERRAGGLTFFNIWNPRTFARAASSIVEDVAAPYLGLAYWGRLASRTLPNADEFAPDTRALEAAGPDDVSRIMFHEPGDEKCPCSRCCAAIPARYTLFRSLDLVMRASLVFLLQITSVWTPIVTLSSALVASWWGTLLLVIYVIVTAGQLPEIVPSVTPSASLNGLVGRVRVRAIKVSLRDLVGELRRTLRGDEDATAEDHAGTRDHGLPDNAGKDRGDVDMRSTYMVLHADLLANWRHGHRGGLFTGAITITLILPALVAAALYVASGLCIPAWTLVMSAYGLLMLLIELRGVATWNSQIDSVAVEYASAAREIREMLASPALLPGIEARKASEHAAVLEGYVSSEGRDAHARFMGFVVDFGSIRVLVVTVATVTFGLWGVLRSLGVGVTMNSACPG
ncbi:hypothetical protein DFJ74DRAFT_656808 [Hyaloraphidium curvatum]|nr:hypothetical protein DFJ74DRAFT_656808 [Hyaloraphidium curvatum]